MVEDVVVKDPLTPEMVDAGQDLVERLDKGCEPVAAAFWFFDTSRSEWLLVLALPMYDDKGPKLTYGRVQLAIAEEAGKANDLRLRNIRVVSPSDPLVRLLALPAPTGPGISRIRIQRNRINDVYIEDALIYRTAEPATQ